MKQPGPGQVPPAVLPLRPSELARRSGTNLSYVCKVLNRGIGPSGKVRFPSWEVACAWADACGISLDQLRKVLDPGSARGRDSHPHLHR